MVNWFFFLLFLAPFSICGQDTFRIGSKRFTESYILGEIIREVANQTKEAKVIYQPGLGNTGIAFAALQNGAIDIYPDYTGTIAQELLKLSANEKIDLDTLNEKLQPLGVAVGVPLGFNNSYALAIREDKADQLNISRISDLISHSNLHMGFSHEFLNRKDGWEQLRQFYHLPQSQVSGMDHSLSYEALKSNQIDVTDVYTTDPKIEKYHLRVLQDDRHFFPTYEAILLYRSDLPQKFPLIWKSLKSLQGTISNEDMLMMNAKAELFGENFEQAASQFLNRKGKETSLPKSSFLEPFFGFPLWKLTKQHLFLVFGSLIPAILVGIPLGTLAAYSSTSRYLILNFVGVIQTIPSLAFFAFLIPIIQQIGIVPALIALFFYALLPIVRNTYAGLSNIPKPLKESAIVLGLPLLPRLALIEMPLASGTILAGIKTAAVMNVGMATIAALIGAGGLGDRIVMGLALNNTEILLSGAIPACILAILVQLSFDVMDRWLVPKGLK